MSIYASTYLPIFICLSNLSICLLIYLSTIYLSLQLSIYLCLSIYVCIYLSIRIKSQYQGMDQVHINTFGTLAQKKQKKTSIPSSPRQTCYPAHPDINLQNTGNENQRHITANIEVLTYRHILSYIQTKTRV